MTAPITGLSVDEMRLVRRLLATISQKRRRNQTRTAYMDGKHLLRKLPPTAPDYLKNLAIVLGWPAKAVEAVANRTRLQGFSASEPVRSELDELLEANDYFTQAKQAQLSSLVHSTVFQTVTAGGEDEPAAVISHVTALNGTGEWDYRRRELKNFIAVSKWPDHERGFAADGAFTLFLDYQVITVANGRVINRVPGIIRMPVTQLPYKPRLDRPFGASRINRAVMSLTDSAVRTMIRSEGTADFYGAPWFMVFGPSESDFDLGAWQLIMNRVNAIPDNEDAANPRADVKQFTQASQQPHVDQLQVIAGAFAGETNIPVSSLGVGLQQANPTSAESYLASREDLITEAEDAQDTWSKSHRQTAIWAWQIANNSREIPAEVRSVQPSWRDARMSSRASLADATVKLVSVFPWMAESDTVIESLGFDAATTKRLLADRRRGNITGALDALASEEVPDGDMERPGGLQTGLNNS